MLFPYGQDHISQVCCFGIENINRKKENRGNKNLAKTKVGEGYSKFVWFCQFLFKVHLKIR